MRRLATSLICILTTLGSVGVFGAEEITYVSVIKGDTGRATSLQRRLPAGLTHPEVGDRVVLHAAKSGNYSVEVTASRRSKFGNSIVHGVTPSGGSSLLVFSSSGSVTGNLYAYDGRVQITTQEGVTNAWRGGIDALPLPMDDTRPVKSQPTYLAPPVENGSRDIRVLNKSVRTGDNLDASEKESESIAYPSYKVGASEISILVFYDEDLSEPSSVIDYVTELSNQVFENSDVDLRLVVADMIQIQLEDTITNYQVSEAMFFKTAAFENIATQRSENQADLVLTMKKGLAAEDQYCGFAYSAGVYKSDAYRNSYVASASWLPFNAGVYCPDLTFAHEVGHLLGGMHLASEYSDSISGAFSYSYAHEEDDIFSTLMVPFESSKTTIERLSSESYQCLGYPCGTDRADHRRTFNATRHAISGFEGEGFVYELITPFKVDGEFSECESDGESGFWKAHGITNQYKEEISWAEVHYVRSDGSARSYSFDKGESTIAPGYSRWRGWCTTENNSDSTDFVESFARYYHPDTDQLVETGHVYFEDDYDGEYSVIRLATSSGGSVIGHPEQHVRVGAKHLVSLVPDPFHKLDRIVTNCEGEDRGDNTYLVEASEDDCRIEAFFKDGGSDVRVQSQFNALLESIGNHLSGRSPSGEATCIGACD